MSYWINKLFFGWLFPKPLSKKEYAARKKANRQIVVGQVSTGSYLLQRGRYNTEEDIKAKRRRVLSFK